MVTAERRRGGSFFDVLGFEELIACLPLFVAPSWRLDVLKDARAQVSLTGTLIQWLDDSSHLHPDMIRCAMYEAEGAVRRAGQQLRTKTPPAQTIQRAHLTLLPGGRLDP